MIRHATIFWVAVAGLFLSALTVVGSEVRTRDQQLAELQDAIGREREKIHVLKAERAYLASPERIAERAAAELGLVELDATRILAIADLPIYIPTPKMEIRPERTHPLLMSAFQNEPESGGLVRAAFLPPPRLESADVLQQTAWVLIEVEQASE